MRYQLGTALLSYALVTSALLCQQAPPSVTGAASGTSALTAEQTLAFRAAGESAAGGKWSDAFAKLKSIHEAAPGNTQIAKFTAEAAINSGDAAYALAIVKPLLQASPQDWQARALLARTYAETHQDAARDAELQQLTTLHASTTDPQFRQQTQVIIERDPLPSGRLDIYYSLQPWSRYNIYEMGRVYNADGKQTLRITLESSDFEQPIWAKQHPDLAAKGERMYSMDGYRDQPPATPGGQGTQTHYTFGFFDGRPAYNTVRDRMIAIANGKGQPMSSTSGIVPK